MYIVFLYDYNHKKYEYLKYGIVLRGCVEQPLSVAGVLCWLLRVWGALVIMHLLACTHVLLKSLTGFFQLKEKNGGLDKLI